MVNNEVEFRSPDKRSGGFLNSALVAIFYVAMFAGLLHWFPVNFSQNKTGQLRSHKNGGSGGAKVVEHNEAITFADVAGVDEAKEELEEIVEFLRNPDRYTKLGARPPRGVLLIFFRGCSGKTCQLLAYSKTAGINSSLMDHQPKNSWKKISRDA